MRVSERIPGAFAVAYQSSDDLIPGKTKVKHYLMKNDDTHGAKKTLPDWLADYRDFACILQLSTDRIENTEKRILHRCPKDAALGEYYSRKNNSQKVKGYEDIIKV
jgi:hypothetical protein